MSEVPIPPASLERLRMAYSQFEQLCAVVAEAMGHAPGTVKSVNLPGGVFVVDDGQGNQAHVEAERVNGVPA
jgi:hypothetical protein